MWTPNAETRWKIWLLYQTLFNLTYQSNSGYTSNSEFPPIQITCPRTTITKQVISFHSEVLHFYTILIIFALLTAIPRDIGSLLTGRHCVEHHESSNSPRFDDSSPITTWFINSDERIFWESPINESNIC